MSDRPPFGRRGAGAEALPPAAAPKRSMQARVGLMAGAGIAAMGLYSMLPSGRCAGDRLYESVDQCMAARVFTDEQCRASFAQFSTGRAVGGVLMSGDSTGATTTPVYRGGSGFTYADGRSVDEKQLCRRGGASGSRSYSGGYGSGYGSGSGSRSFFGLFSGSSAGTGTTASPSTSAAFSGSPASAGSSSSSAVVSRGGFGATGAGFSGGGS